MQHRRVTETILASSALSWGIWLLLPFNTYGSSVTFSVLADIAPEWVVGSAMFLAGLLLFVGGVRQSYCLRRWSLVAIALMWAILWMAFLLGNWRSTATVTYIWWFVLSVYSYLRVGRNGVFG